MIWKNPKTGRFEQASDGQQIAKGYPLTRIVSTLQRKVTSIRSRKAADRGKVGEPDRRIMSGARCIRGTRIPTETIASFAAAGYSVEQIIEQYPQLDAPDVSAAIRFEERRTEQRKKRRAA